MDKQMLVWMYCGLDWGKYQDLDSAYHGTLATVNGARREAMHPLISKDCQASDLGCQMWARAQIVMRGDYDACPDTFVTFDDCAKAARLVNKYGRGPAGMKMCAADLKVLRAVGRNPGLSWGFLTTVYGWRTVKSMEDAGLLEARGMDDRYPKWHWYVLTGDAIHLLDDLGKWL